MRAYLDRRRNHLYVQDLESGAVAQLTAGDFDDSQPAWSPDGQLIAFVSNRTEEPDANSNTDIWVVSANSPDAGGTLLQVTTNPGADSAPAWSPDGQTITYTTVTEPDIIWYATNHLAVSPATGGAARVLTSRLDRNVSSPRFAPDGSEILFVLEDSAERHLASIDITGESFRRRIAGQHSLRGFTMNDNGQTATLIGSADQPPEVFFQDDGQLRQMTFTQSAVAGFAQPG